MNVTADLHAALRNHYPPPEWVLAFEVQASRDDGGLRFADAIAFDTRKGAGMTLHGFETKVSRGDWKAELSKPGKSVAARSLVDYWWLVLGSAEVALDEEVPPTWGILQPGPDDVLVVRRVAARRPLSIVERGQVDRALIAALLRRLDTMEPRAYWEGRERRAEAKGYAKGRNAAGRVQRKRAGKEPEGELNLP